MEKKKNEKSNLEKKSIIFFEFGIIVTLSVLLLAFEWGTEKTKMVNEQWTSNSIDDEPFMPVSIRKDIKVRPPITPETITIIENIEPEIEDIVIDWGVDVTSTASIIPDIEMDDEDEVHGDPIDFAEKMPTYKGQNTARFQQHLQELVKYPADAMDAGIGGKVFLQFVVDQKGNIIQAKIVKSPHSSLSEAVLLALKKTDQWQPGEQLGRKVKVRFTVPINFKLTN